jgi:septum formation protein
MAGMEKLVLASSSPRRKELLTLLGIPFIPVHPEIDESVCDHLPPDERVLALARLKAEAGRTLSRQRELMPRLILAADTLVALRRRKSWQVIGKPASRDDARTMLVAIQGRVQHVFTGLCLLDAKSGQERSALSDSTVNIAPMTAREIEAYLDLNEWEGAAGAYRVQGWGAAFIKSMSGSPSGVMGLPIHELYGILSDVDFDFSARD